MGATEERPNASEKKPEKGTNRTMPEDKRWAPQGQSSSMGGGSAREREDLADRSQLPNWKDSSGPDEATARTPKEGSSSPMDPEGRNRDADPASDGPLPSEDEKQGPRDSSHRGDRRPSPSVVATTL
jgi:hypothetical protein